MSQWSNNTQLKITPAQHFALSVGNVFQVGPPHLRKWPALSSLVTCARRCHWEMSPGQKPQEAGLRLNGFRPDEGN